jgi:restriction system protein
MARSRWWQGHHRQDSERDHSKDWRRYGYALTSIEQQLDRLQHQSVFDPLSDEPLAQAILGFYTVNVDGLHQLALPQIGNLLSAEHLDRPQGRELLEPLAPPKLPGIPRPPSSDPGSWDHVVKHRERVEDKLREKGEKFKRIAIKDKEMLTALTEGYEQLEPKYVEFLASLSLVRHYLPKPLFRPSDTHYDPVDRVILCDLEVPNFADLQIVKRRGTSYKWVPVSTSERKKALEAILYSLCIRAAYLIAKSDINDRFDTVAVNARQQWFDSATGAPREGTVASLHALKEELAGLQIGHIDPKACFRHFKGIATPSTDEIAPVRPIFVMNTTDSRVVGARDIDAGLAAEANLAAMPWEDFEHLVRQLFEWEFGRNGVEVKVTRASRDRGVDAIMFDPDPLRGGKYVLQAKRYTRTVDVAAVRDLYGTVVNEGANRGVLVTTSSFGPDAYEFAKDKPISLVDGPNLIAMLQRHGRKYRIDLAEARRRSAALDNDNP